MIAALALARRFWPAIAVIAALVALWAWGNHREAQGVASERATWEAEAARLRAVATEEATQRFAAVLQADSADRVRMTAQAAAMAAQAEGMKRYANTPNGRAVCLDRAGGLLINEAVAAANASIAAGSAARR